MPVFTQSIYPELDALAAFVLCVITLAIIAAAVLAITDR
jgi:hypothetical protein